MRTITDLLPLAIGIIVTTAVTWFLLDRNIHIGKWLLGLLLFAHGWVHVMFLFPAPEAAPATAGDLQYPFDMGRSWLITRGGLEDDMVRVLGSALVVGVLGAFVLATASTVGLLVSRWLVGFSRACRGSRLDAAACALLLAGSPARLPVQSRSAVDRRRIRLESSGRPCHLNRILEDPS